MTDKQKKELLSNSQFIKFLKTKQILQLIWWDIFNKKRINVFYEGLDLGKSTFFAFKDAKNGKNKKQ